MEILVTIVILGVVGFVVHKLRNKADAAIGGGGKNHKNDGNTKLK